MRNGLRPSYSRILDGDAEGPSVGSGGLVRIDAERRSDLEIEDSPGRNLAVGRPTQRPLQSGHGFGPPNTGDSGWFGGKTDVNARFFPPLSGKERGRSGGAGLGAPAG